MAGQIFRYYNPSHCAGRLIANFLTVHNATDRTLNEQTFVRVLLLIYNQFVQTLQMHQMLTPAQRYCRILGIVSQFVQTHWTRLSVWPFWWIDDAYKSTDRIAGRIHTDNRTGYLLWPRRWWRHENVVAAYRTVQQVGHRTNVSTERTLFAFMTQVCRNGVYAGPTYRFHTFVVRVMIASRSRS